MNKDWIELSQTFSKVIDHRGKTPKKLGLEWADKGYRALSALNVKTNGLENIESIRHANEELYRKWMKDEIQRGDILLTSEAPAGQVMVWDSDEKILLSQRIFALRLKKEYDSYFIKYFLQSDTGQKEINKNASGSTVFGISAKMFDLIKVPNFKKERQAAISKVLRCLDAKIELNNKMNRELEAMAKTLYDYWFVQFDFPDANGKPYKSSGGNMVYNEELKSEVPEGWGVRPLSRITSVSNDSVNPMLTPEKDFKHYSIPTFDATKTYGIEKGIDIRSNKFSVKENDLLVSKLNPWFSRVIYPIKEDDLVCSTEFVVWRTANDNIKNYLFMVARAKHFISHCTQSATGTSNSHKRVNPSVMMRYKVPYNADLIEKYGASISPIIKDMISKQRENQQLSAIRDWLLPMLMNGQVKVKSN